MPLQSGSLLTFGYMALGTQREPLQQGARNTGDNFIDLGRGSLTEHKEMLYLRDLV